MNEYKVSVIVPVYNVEEYIERCLESLINQTLQEIEVIIVNDGSPDNSQLIIDKYVKMYPDKIKSFIKENGGLSDARNFGMKYAKGSFIGFVDSDDYVDITMYEKLYNKAIEEEADITVCGYFGVDEKNNKLKKLQSGNMKNFGKSIFENPKLLYINAPYAWNKLYKRDIFIENNMEYPKGLVFEDISTTYPLLLHANKISKVDEPLYFYILKRDGSITGTYSPKSIQLIDSLARLNDHYIKNEYFISFKKELEFINLKHIYNRLFEYKEYDNKEFKLQFLDKAFIHLDNYFPGWREFSFFFDWIIGKNKVKQKMYKNKKYWELISCLSSKTIKKMIKTTKEIKKMKSIIKKVKNKNINNKFIYAVCRKYGKIRKNTVLFESFHGTTISDSPYYIMKELVKDKKFKIYFTTNNYKKHKEYIKVNKLPIKLVKLKSFKYQSILANCEYLVNNVSYPEYFIKKKGQYYLNTWHGTPLKTLGKNMRKGIESMHNIQRNFLQSDLLLFPNEFTKKVTMEDYNLEDIYTGSTIVNGYPRNSIFKNKDKAKEIRKKLNIENKTVYVYMPTWRGKNSINVDGKADRDQLFSILTLLDNKMKDHQVMYINLHPIVARKIKISKFKHIFAFPINIDNYKFINCADVLITDYSSIFFDFSITKKPIIMFMYDYEQYMENRGVYLDISTLPFQKIYEVNEFIDVIVNEKIKQYKNDEDYNNKYIKYDTATSSKDLTNQFFYNQLICNRISNYEKNMDKVFDVCFIPTISTREQLNELCKKYNLECTIFIFELDKFNEKLNLLLFEEFNEKIKYIVIKKMKVLTYKEAILYKLKTNNYQDIILKQEMKRCLPNLKIRKVFKE